MGNVELIELKTSVTQCPSCLHYVLKATLVGRCGKHIRPDLDMMRRIRAAFEVLKAPCFRTSAIDARVYKHGPNLWQNTTKQKTHCAVVRKTNDSIRQSRTDGKDTKLAGSPSWSIGGQILG